MDARPINVTKEIRNRNFLGMIHASFKRLENCILVGGSLPDKQEK
jgi:hypothetical protein